MSSNKLTTITPSLSLGPAPQSSTDLSTLTSNTQPALNSLHTQPMVASPLGTHTLNLSANTLNALNNNPTQMVNTFNTSTQAMNTLSSPHPTQPGNPSPQPLLSSPQVTSIVSLPQSFCFTSQPSQSSAPAAGASQPAATALGVTLGFPMAAAAAAAGLSSNTISLNTNSFPLSANTFPLNTGNALPQQFVQSLSLGQQPTICTSLPQTLSFPLSQTLFSVPSASGGSGAPFLSTGTFTTQFPGLQSVIMGGHPTSVLQGALVSGTSAAAQGAAQLQALGTLTPQSLSFPVTAGPVLTELPGTAQQVPAAGASNEVQTDQTLPAPATIPQAEQFATAPPPDSQPGQYTPAPVTDSQPSEFALVPPNSTMSDQCVPTAPLTEPQSDGQYVAALSNPQPDQVNPAPLDNSSQSDQFAPVAPSPAKEPSETPSDQQDSLQPPVLVDPQQAGSQALSDLPQGSETPSSWDQAEVVTVIIDQTPQLSIPVPDSEVSEQLLVSAPEPMVAEQQSTPEPEPEAAVSQQAEEAVRSETDLEQTGSGSVTVTVSDESRPEESAEKMVNSGDSTSSPAQDVQSTEGQVAAETMETDTSAGDIKQEAEESEEAGSSFPPSTAPGASDFPDASVTPSQGLVESSPIKVEASTDQVDGMDPAGESSTDSTNVFYATQPEPEDPKGDLDHNLLTQLKQEAMDAEEEEELALPDSTPGSEDSLDSYSHQRHSPSPMASLQLTRADTTTVTTTSAYAKPRLDDREGGMFDNAQLQTMSETVPTDNDESEFVWEDYLQETGATAVPPTAFKHVECSLQSGFVKGMRVEVPNRSTQGTYWVAAVIMTCGPLLRLRYEGYEDDASRDFWCDLSTWEIHPIGWCAENKKSLIPPEGIQDKHQDWMAALQDILKTAPAAPSYLLDKTTGTSPIDQLKQGMRLELQDIDRPNQLWLARIMENVGGRLYLRVEGVDSGVADFWAFYLNERLHPIGWAKSRGYSYVPPKVLTKQGLSESEIQQILDTTLKEAEEQNLPADIFKDQARVKEHKFKRGMKMEAVNPNSGNHIGPATVVEVIDSFYFIVEMDDLSVTEPGARTRFSCHSGTPTIFPIQWTVYKGIKLTAPEGWPKPDFNWTEYLNHCRAMAVPENCFRLDYEKHEFERGMKLECVNPDSPNQICAATITKLVAHLMWVHLDSSKRIVASHVEHVTSHNLFPVGWCESNGFQLRSPCRAGPALKRVAVVQPEMAEGTLVKEEDNKGRSCCPQIFFNHKCFSGPHLSKGRIAELPCSVGPGPLGLVMKEVLTMLISVAYKSSRVLREIQMDGPPNPAMTQQVLKAKYKNKSYRAVVEICRNTNQLEDFCRQVCIKLECCPNLISPHFVGDKCPEHCSQLTKTKYTYYYGKKKRKIGRPPGGHSNLENGPKKPSKRRKRRRLGMVVRKSHSINGEGDEEEGEEGEEDDKTSEASDTSAAVADSTVAPRLHAGSGGHKPHATSASLAISNRLKRKYTHHIPPPSEIQTRGAKLPRYSFERRTHKKILLSPTPSGVSGLRSKTLQSHQTHHKASKFARAPSPEPSQPPQQQPVSMGTSAHHHHHHHHQNSTLSQSQCSSPLSVSCPSTTHLSMVSPSSTPFSLPPPCSPLALDKNPLHWTVAETVDFIKTTDCAHVAKLFRDQEIDGQALLLLTLPTVQEHLELKLGPAIKLCHEIERVKRAFYTRYDKSPTSSTHF